MSTSWNWPGSRWWRVDLHCHSPASHDFQSEGSPSSTDWIGWVEAARDAGLDAVAITDHNTAAAVDPLREAATQVDNAPVLFPGVGLTAADGFHLLLLMDPAREGQHVQDLLSAMQVPVETRGTQEGRSPLSAEEILGRCDDQVLVVGAHVNRAGGLLQLPGQQRIEVLGHPQLAAVEVNPSYEVDRSWLDGGRSEIGRSIPIVHGSDSHHFGEHGRRHTWIKMTRPDLDGLRLAMLDGTESLRVFPEGSSADPNRKHAPQAIESIEVRTARYMGRSDPITVRLNPWLNVIIGGRGTGKSTLVDFCRKALRRDGELDTVERSEEGSLRTLFDRRMQVPSQRYLDGLLTKDTRIEVVYRKDRTRFVLGWSQDGSARPIALLDGDSRHPEEGDIRERFPMRIYSQKQLFAIAQNPKALLTVIDDSEEVSGGVLLRRMEELSHRYLALRAEARSEKLKAADIANRKAALADVRRKLDVLEEGGQARALNDYRRRRQRNNTWTAILRHAQSGLDAASESIQEILVADLDRRGDYIPDDHYLTSLHASLTDNIDSTRSDLERIVQEARRRIQGILSSYDAEQWQARLDASHREVERVKAELAAEGITDPADYSQLLAQEARLRLEIDSLTASAARAKRIDSEADEVLANYRKVREELSTKRCHFAGHVSNETFQVEILPLEDTGDLADQLGEAVGSEFFEKDREALARDISGKASPWEWERLDDFIGDAAVIREGGQVARGFKDGRFAKRLQGMEPERSDRLGLYVPEDEVSVSFRDDDTADWRPLEHGSPGQQTAALLAFVLGHGTEPIVLDQPEDDLDNTLIYDLLVTTLRRTKQTRQVMVVTHNPNIVVHGDAELVISLESHKGQSRMDVVGGLQESRVRAEICRVMEGGREAFERRYRRIMPRDG